MNLSVVYAFSLLILCAAGCVLTLIADEWPLEARIRLAILLVIVACIAVLGMYP